MNKISKSTQLLIGVALFSMFFGAGNLIFPPLLGYQAGVKSLPAFIGLAISAVGLPIFGVIAVSRVGDLKTLAGRVCKPFAAIYAILIYLSIGPLLAIPRNGSTSFEMAVSPFIPSNVSTQWIQFAYTVVFFGIALFFALRPNKLVDLLGKRMAPILLILVGSLFVGGIIYGLSGSNQPSGDYATTVPAAQGFLNGYQTMDAIVSLIYGAMLVMSIRDRGVTDAKATSKIIFKSGLIAGAIFLAVYGSLTWLGAVGTQGLQAQNGAVVLSHIARVLYGSVGQIILGAIFVIACLNTCITLICCCSEYFNKLCPKISYTVWAIAFSAFSLIISNFGLNLILKISVPILNAVYPPAIVLIILAFLPKGFEKSRPTLYPLSIGLTSVFSVLYSISDIGLNIPLINSIPLASFGLGWVIPAIVGVAIGCIIKTKSSVQAE